MTIGFFLLLGPRLPVTLLAFTMVNTIIGPMVIGGEKVLGGFASSQIFNLVCSGSGTDVRSSCYWRKFDQELQVARSVHVVIPLGDSFAHKMCNSGMF